MAYHFKPRLFCDVLTYVSAPLKVRLTWDQCTTTEPTAPLGLQNQAILVYGL